MDHALTVDVMSVLERTDAGQKALLNPSGSLSELAYRLLSVVTGFTPLHDLAAIVGTSQPLIASAQALLSHGLLRVVDDHGMPTEGWLFTSAASTLGMVPGADMMRPTRY